MSQLPFGPATHTWFTNNFEAPTPVQDRGWQAISRGEHALLLAPTGSGKTLAAFLWAIDRLIEVPAESPGVRVVYVSPLKALVYDIERNLRSPLVGISHHAREGTPPRVAIRTGDTPPRERQTQARNPAEILVTTPESLYLLLTSQARQTLTTVETVIVDEVHVMAATKRGAHLALSLERLTELTGRDPQRIGLSATVRPVDEVAAFLGGRRPVTVIDTLQPPRLDLQVLVPVDDMENPAIPATTAPGGSLLHTHQTGSEGNQGLWPALYPRLLAEIQAHRSTILFVNSRGLCERLALRLNELAGEELVKAHHGSVSFEERNHIEEGLKSGRLRGIVATSSLELGIDMGSVDLVLLVESPGAVSRGLQRVGRAGHGVGEVSIGRIYPKFRGDLLECAVVSKRMLDGAIEALRMPRNPLDVLAQQIVAMCVEGPRTLSEIEAVVTRAANFRELSRDLLVEVLDMLSGRYPGTEFGELKARLDWDRATDTLSARRGTRQLAVTSGGTIPDRGLFGVFLSQSEARSARVGELDEEMVYEIRAGQNFTLGASTWRVDQITRDRVLVSPAPGEPGRMPFWKGDGPGRPVELGREVGAFTRELAARLDDNPEGWVAERCPLDPKAVANLVAYVREQREHTGTVPTDRTLTVERFRDELGDWRVCILSPFGSRVHAPWALALEALLSRQAGFEVQALWTDDGIVLRFAEGEELPPLPALSLDPDELEDLLIEQLGNSALFAANFRENAGRSLLLPRNRPGQRTPLWQQRLKAQGLLAVARNYPSFPIILETYRSCLQDVFDVPALKGLLRSLQRRELHLEEVETPSPSPFARSLVFSYVAAYLYQGDAPLAERRAQALTLDRNLLSELLGQEELRELLDAGVLAELESELQQRSPERQAEHSEGLHDLLRRLGELTEEEVAERCAGDGRAWLQSLERERKVLKLRLASRPVYLAAEDAGLYRDALGCALPGGLPERFLQTHPAPLEALLIRYARQRGPFLTSEPARRWGLAAAQLEPSLQSMVHRHLLLSGEFRPGGSGREWCDPEVLRRWRRRTLARLRGQVAPVEAAALARFLGHWQGLEGSARSGQARLTDAIAGLEGLPLSFSELEKSLLPARLGGDYQSRWLDELGQLGVLIWVGHSALSHGDGRIILCRRERASALLEQRPAPPEDPVARRILDVLSSRGASFLMEIRSQLPDLGARAVEQAMEDLIWAGHITNDLFSPLRNLGPRKSRGRGGVPSLAGRWTLVANLTVPVEPTARAHAWALTWLDRYGVVSREMAQNESVPGGYATVYPILKAMEEAGKVRRGYFVEGLSGAQFASSGAIDRLRACSEPNLEARVLAAIDPANPYGAILPWPECAGRARRVAGARVILVGGRAVVFLERGARRLLTFPAAREPEILDSLRPALWELARKQKGKALRLTEIDGQAALGSAWSDTLLQLGFVPDYPGLMLLARE